MNKSSTWIRYVGDAAMVALAFLVVLIVFDATSRYLFSKGSVAMQELQWHLFDVVIMLGIACAMRRGAHVRVDLFYERFSDKMKNVLDLVTMVLFVIPFSCLMMYVGYDFVMMSYVQSEGSADPGGLPYRFLIKSLIPLAFLLLAIQSVLMTVQTIRRIK